MRSEKETLAGEVEVLHNSIEARKQALLGLAGRLLEAIERTGKERQNTLAALEGMEEFRQSHIERLGILRKEYIKIAARNVGIKRDRYRDIAADVSDDAKDFEENTLDQPEAVSALDEIADLVKILQDDVAGVDRAPGTDSPDAEPGADPDQELPPPDKDQGNDPDQELPPPDAEPGNDPDQELLPPDADPDQRLEAPDTDPDHGSKPAKSGGK